MATSRGQPRRQLPDGPKTANEELFDALIRHQIRLMQLAEGTGRRVTEILDESEADLRQAIHDRLRAAGTGLDTTAKTIRLHKLLDEVVKIRRVAHKKAWQILTTDMKGLAKIEPTFVNSIVHRVLPVTVNTVIPPPDLLRTLATTKPFEGKTLRGWAKHVETVDIRRIQDQITIGMTQGESTQAIARRVTGTVKLKGVDGVTQVTRRNAEAIARTATNAIANEARAAYFKENVELFPWEIFVATLDSKTTPICQSLDGNRYRTGKGPVPPVHIGCRSLRMAVLDGDVLGNRPAKPFTERQLLREFSTEQGLKRAPTIRANLPRGTKGKYDVFARARTRELIGQVPAKTNYQTWLRGQTTDFQNDLLGTTKGRLFRDGGLTLDKFVNPAGKELSLSSLAKLEAEAFTKVGLDPAEFIK